MKHPAKINGFSGSIKDAARAIAVMRYDSIRDLFKALAVEFKAEAEKDKKSGRRKLAVQLRTLALSAEVSAEILDKIWKLCKKYM